MKKDLDIFEVFCYYTGQAKQKEATMKTERQLLRDAVYALDSLIATQPDPTYYTAEFDHADAVSEEIWELLKLKDDTDE